MASSSPNSKRAALEPPEKITTVIERSSKRARVDVPGRIQRFKRKHQEHLDNRLRPQLLGLNKFLSSTPMPPREEERWNSLRKAVADAVQLSSKPFLRSPSSMTRPPTELERKRSRSKSDEEDQDSMARNRKKLKRSHKNGYKIPSTTGFKRSRDESEVDHEGDDGLESEDEDDIERRREPGREDVGFKRPRTSYIQEGDPEIEYASTIEVSDSDSSSYDSEDYIEGDYSANSDDEGNDGDSDG